MKTKHKEKSVPGVIRNTSRTNRVEKLADDSRGFVTLDFSQNSENLQSKILATINPAPKIIRVHRCFCCNRCFTQAKFSTYFGICRECFTQHRDPKLRGKFAESVARNVRRVLGGAK